MALSNLTPLTQAQYRALNIMSFPFPPSVTSTGSPDPKVGIQLGGWVGTNLLAFMITDAINTDSSLAIDPNNTNTLDLNVLADSDPSTEITYWTVDMGAGASGTNWQLSIKVEASGTNTGTWVFTKGKGVDPKLGY